MNPTKTDDTYSFTSVHMHGCFGIADVVEGSTSPKPPREQTCVSSMIVLG